MTQFREESDVAKPFNKKKKIRKRFGVEHLGPKMTFPKGVLVWEYEWRIHRWYATEKQRDTALAGLLKSICNIYKRHTKVAADSGPRYRKVDR